MEKLEVLYNAECPICRSEIEHDERLSGDDVDYVAITPDIVLDWGLTEDQAAEKLHARRGGDVCRSVTRGGGGGGAGGFPRCRAGKADRRQGRSPWSEGRLSFQRSRVQHDFALFSRV